MAYYKKKTFKKVVQGISFLVLLVFLVPSVNADFTVNDSLNLSYCKSSLNSIDSKLTTTNSDLSQINSTLVTLNSNVLSTNTNMNSQLTSVNTKLTNIYTDVNGIKADFDTLLSDYSDLISDVAELRDLVDLITTKIDSIDTKLLTISTTLSQFKVQNHTDLVQIDDDILSQTESLTEKLQFIVDALNGKTESITADTYSPLIINGVAYYKYSADILENYSLHYVISVSNSSDTSRSCQYFLSQYNYSSGDSLQTGDRPIRVDVSSSSSVDVIGNYNKVGRVYLYISRHTSWQSVSLSTDLVVNGLSNDINTGVDNLNNTMTNTDGSSSDIDLPTADMSGAPDTSTALNGFFITLQNAFTGEGVQSVAIPIPFVNQSITITSGVAMDRLPASLKNLISMVYWFIISRYIFLDVSRRIDKIKEGNVDGAVSSNIKEDLL